jgi:hypothetical protein
MGLAHEGLLAVYDHVRHQSIVSRHVSGDNQSEDAPHVEMVGMVDYSRHRDVVQD